MSNKMDVDIQNTPENINFHPLAIVHMSDQYTRITSGGSVLPKDAPVVGILFGTYTDKSNLAILDADDIPLTATPEKIQQQTQLHQVVFPLQEVVGWYRVSGDREPNAQDIKTSMDVQKMFPGARLFCATQIDDDIETSGDDNLMTLYRLDESNPVLVAHEQWKLDTSEVEQIAVERVVREKNLGKGDSAYIANIATVRESLEHMKDRVQVLTQFLADTQSQKIPFNPKLVREVKKLICELGPLLSQEDKEVDQTSLQDIATLGKTIMVAQSYAQKVQPKTSQRGGRLM